MRVRFAGWRSTTPLLRIPHTGWSEVRAAVAEGSPLAGARPGEAFYFNHSYHVVP